MADQSVTRICRIVDKTILTQGLSVNAAGEIPISIISTSVTPGIGALHLGKAEDAAHATGDVGVFALVVRKDTAAQLAGTDADYSGLINDANGLLWTRIGAALPAGTNIIGSISIDQTTPGNTNKVDTELPDAAALADATANPTVPGVGSFLMGFNGTTWDRVRTANTGRLQVDVVSGGGGSVPTNATVVLASTASLAANASADIDSGSLDSKYLWHIIITGSVAFKAVLKTNDNGTTVNKGTFFGGPGRDVNFRPPPGFIQAPAATTGEQGFRVTITNILLQNPNHYFHSTKYAICLLLIELMLVLQDHFPNLPNLLFYKECILKLDYLTSLFQYI